MGRGASTEAEGILYGGSPRLHSTQVLTDLDPRWEFPKLDDQSLIVLSGTTGYPWKDALRDLDTTEQAERDESEVEDLHRIGIGYDGSGRLWNIVRVIADYGSGEEMEWRIWGADKGAPFGETFHPGLDYPQMEGAEMVFECRHLSGPDGAPKRRPSIRIDQDNQVTVDGEKLTALI